MIVLALISTLSGPAASQPRQAAPPPDSWVLTRQRNGDLLAAAPFDNGITLAARCAHGAFDLMIDGLPPAGEAGSARPLTVKVGDAPGISFWWTVSNAPSAAFSRIPGLTSRRLLRGGVLEIIVPGAEGGPRTRYVMTLSPDSPALKEAMTHCGRRLVDPRDDVGSASGDAEPARWVVAPRPNYPTVAETRGQRSGMATLACTPDAEGALRDCEIESEYPVGFRFGEAALRAAAEARVTPRASGDASDGARLRFTIAFRMSDEPI